ncbi:MAG TPA: ATP-dependent DNA ligase [Gemmatales bacterium]|nr:ATP-dependent DNA ligase [Gemmatales bacterium]
MLRFTELYDDLDSTTRTNEKVAALVRYFRDVPPEDAIWAVYFFTGRRLPRVVNSTLLRQWAAEAAGYPGWLLDECYQAVGDQSETIALLLPEPNIVAPPPLSQFIQQRIIPMKKWHDEKRRQVVEETWKELNTRQRFLFHKLMGGSFRVGVAKTLVVRALARVAGIPVAVMSYRVMGDWQPTAEAYQRLMAPEAETDTSADAQSRPYPFFLASPLTDPLEELGAVNDWQIEWKWDGIRAQVIRRGDHILIWSRGEELITDRFPEIVRAVDVAVPEGTVLDGELLAWMDDHPLPFAQLQRRIGRKKVTPRIMNEVPIVFLAYDLLEWQSSDLRSQPQSERRQLLEAWHAQNSRDRLRLSPNLPVANWDDVTALHQHARQNHTEGLMLKRKAAPYGVSRTRGDWWKWKIDPFHIDAVLVYAQSGSGKRASLFTDYTFALWNEGELVPVAKAYSGLTNEEIKQVDQFIRTNTLERFGPVRVVKPELVFELAFEGIQASPRHKSGVAVRFPRMARWRTDKKPEQADTLEVLKELAVVQRAGM